MNFKEWKDAVTFVHGDEAKKYVESNNGILAYPHEGWIERTDTNRGSWQLTIGNQCHLTNDILELEARLYLWMASERVFFDDLNNDTLFKWCIEREFWLRDDTLYPEKFKYTYTDFEGRSRSEEGDDPRDLIVMAYAKDSVRQYFKSVGRTGWPLDLDLY